MKELIDRVLRDFNFEKVHKVMLVVNWRWIRSTGVPSISDLVLCAQELLQDVAKMDAGFSISTGGFRATKTENEDEGEGLELEFILTSKMFCTKWLEDGE